MRDGIRGRTTPAAGDDPAPARDAPPADSIRRGRIARSPVADQGVGQPIAGLNGACIPDGLCRHSHAWSW
jgi:hypothetical protein